MTLAVVRVAVVGHTNTGKTSLLRTLTRDVTFGEVSDRPATTRHVEGVAVLVNGQPAMELYDTPGLEDSIGMLEHLDRLADGRRIDGIDLVKQFLESDVSRTTYSQEAKSLRQVIDGDIALYVIDARDRVLAKHRDELEILARCATPVVPVLNFTASADARTAQWREHMSRANMHAVAEFDTVVIDDLGEQRLYEKMRSLLDSRAATLDALIAQGTRRRDNLVRGSAELVADLLIDAASFVAVVPVDDEPAMAAALDNLRHLIREREQRCVRQLLELHRFRAEDCNTEAMPLEDGRWGLDLFSPEAARYFGINTGSGVAAGVAVGLLVDAMSAGITLGAATATGAAIGGLLGAGRSHARRLLDRARGRTELRCDDTAVRLLAVRQLALARALLGRGHAAQKPVQLGKFTSATRSLATAVARLPAPLRRARVHARWSRLDGDQEVGVSASANPSRGDAVRELAQHLREKLTAGKDGGVDMVFR